MRTSSRAAVHPTGVPGWVPGFMAQTVLGGCKVAHKHPILALWRRWHVSLHPALLQNIGSVRMFGCRSEQPQCGLSTGGTGNTGRGWAGVFSH